MKVKLKEDYRQFVSGRCELSVDKPYVVLGVEADDYRIVDDRGDPVLFSPNLFNIVDLSAPEDWVSSIGDDGERYAYPAELNDVGFFERYFDREDMAVQTFRNYLEKQRQ